ncbi:MAG: AAA family ATPase [Candidatus Aenigmarchaeota archaeon]|nr:AAA family ATPase [Candidatus Aenigmarchaeota archaeon]
MDKATEIYKNLVLGLVGKRACGKDAVAQYLSKKYSFVCLDYTNDILEPILKEKNEQVTRENLVKLSMSLRKEYGNDILTRKICEKIEPGLWVISGVRFREEVEYFNHKFGDKFKLISVECDSRIRYERAIKRGIKGEAKLSYEEFLDGENLPTEQVIPETMQLADFTINNDGSFAKLHEEIDKLMEKLRI